MRTHAALPRITDVLLRIITADCGLLRVTDRMSIKILVDSRLEGAQLHRLGGGVINDLIMILRGAQYSRCPTIATTAILLSTNADFTLFLCARALLHVINDKRMTIYY